jgi:hypothetical protein
VEGEGIAPVATWCSRGPSVTGPWWLAIVASVAVSRTIVLTIVGRSVAAMHAVFGEAASNAGAGFSVMPHERPGHPSTGTSLCVACACHQQDKQRRSANPPKTELPGETGSATTLDP